METGKKLTSKTRIIIGGLMIIIAVLAVMLIKLKPKPPEAPEYVRPVKTYQIGQLETISSWKYTGKIRPNEEVEMSFDVAGTVTDLLVNKGVLVKKGDLLAKLDPRDFQNEIDVTKARKARAEAQLARMEKAIKMNAVSQQEYDDAIAQYEVASAELLIKEKALEDASLHARFDGRIADTFIDQFQNVRAKQPILTLHDASTVDVIANVAEQRVLFSSEEDRKNYRHTAVFDFIPDTEYDLTLKEFSTEADPNTQTYQATFTMPQPEGIMLLAGMSATVYEYNLTPGKGRDAGYLAPLSAVPVDSTGTYYVWKLTDVQGKTTVERVDVRVDKMSGENILILEGIQQGDLIAAAGVHFLRDGQQVRPMK